MRTKLNPSQIKSIDIGGDGSMKYVGVEHTTPAHVGNDTVIYEIPFPETLAGVLIQTIRIESEVNLNFTIDLMDGNTNRTIYESLEETRLQYDLVSIPYKPAEGKFFVRIGNKSSLTTKFTIIIRGIEVK